MRDLVGAVTVDAYVPAAGSARRDAGALLAVTVFLVLVGLLTVYSASSFLAISKGLPDHYFLRQQASRALVGLVGLYVVARIDYRIYQSLAWPLLGATVFMLLLVVMPGTDAIAPPRNGARRWIEVGVSIQPSEIAKLVMVIWAATLATKKGERVRSLRWGLAGFGVVYCIVGFLIMLEPDLSSVALIGYGMFLLLPAIAKNKLPLIVEVSFRYRAVQTPLYAFSISVVGQPFQFQQHIVDVRIGRK